MTKHKKKKSRKSAPAEISPAGAPKAHTKRFNFRRAIFIALTTLAVFTLYETLIAVPALRVGGIPIIMPVYFVIVTALICAIIFFNHGFSKDKLTPDMFSEDNDAERVKALCETVNRHKLIAKKLMFVLLPFLFSIFFDIIYLFYGDFFAGALSLIFGSK